MNTNKIPHTLRTDPAVVAELETRVLQAAAAGEQRISILTVMGQVRDDLKLSANNSDAPKLADSLIQHHPHLDAVIQRRTRGVRGPNKRKAATDLAAITAVLASAGIEIESLVVRIAGKSWRIAPSTIDRALAKAA